MVHVRGAQAQLLSARTVGVALERLVQDLEALAAAESAGLHLEVEPLDLAEVVEDLASLHAPRLTADGLQLEIAAQPAPVAGDPVRLGQIVTNLLTNAARFVLELPRRCPATSTWSPHGPHRCCTAPRFAWSLTRPRHAPRPEETAITPPSVP